MFKWTVRESIISSASPQSVWNLWKNVGGWPQWDTHLEWSTLDGDFALHTHGSLQPKGMSPVQFKIVELTPGKSFSTRTELFMTNMIFSHTITKVNSGIEITHMAKVSGLLAPILYFAMRKNVIKGFRDSLQKLTEIAQREPKI